uniref:Uncharacterized protein n=1 Tax=Onchocerca volvulus TaxID=6282 RepID=A0A8R1TYU5_ONCVO
MKIDRLLHKNDYLFAYDENSEKPCHSDLTDGNTKQRKQKVGFRVKIIRKENNRNNQSVEGIVGLYNKI